MEDIELVIKIDKDIAQGIIDGKNDAPRNIVRAFQATIADAIKNGTPLPKGHGRLFDERDIVDGSYEIIGNKIYELDPILEADISGEEQIWKL